MEDVAEAQQPNSSSASKTFPIFSVCLVISNVGVTGEKKPLGWFSEIEADSRDSICAVSVLGGADAGLCTSRC